MTVQKLPVANEVPHRRMIGNCKWFNDLRGFGFIGGTDGREYFVHQSSIVTKGYRNLEVNQEVEFEVIVDNNKLKAVNVTAPGGLKLKSGGRKPQKSCVTHKKWTSYLHGSYTKFSNADQNTGNLPNAKRHFSGGGSISSKTFGCRGHTSAAAQREEQLLRGICYSWRRGECHRGELCRFDHPKELKNCHLLGSSEGVCYQWQEGTCHKGKSCKLAHFPTE